MTTTEVAERLGIASTTVRRQIEQGCIAARKVGRDWHVTPREVERYRARSLGRPGRKPAVPVSPLIRSVVDHAPRAR